MFEKKIVILTNNKSLGSYYLIRQVRSHFNKSTVISTHYFEPSLLAILKFFKNTYKYLAYRIFFNYKYPFNYKFFPVSKVDLCTKDINGERVEELIKKISPDIIVFFGTKKINTKILKLCKYTLNIHLGFVPHYRGVSSALWVTKHNNPHYYHYCIHKATEKLDEGAILSMERVLPQFFESLSMFRSRLSFEAVKKVIDVLKNIKCYDKNSFSQPTTRKFKTYKHIDMPDNFNQKMIKHFNSKNFKTFFIKNKKTNNLESVFKKFSISKYSYDNFQYGWYVLNYHHIVNSGWTSQNFKYKVPRIYTEISNFKNHIHYLKSKFEFISITEGLKALREDNISDRYLLSITFDDGLSSYNEVATFLKDNNVIPTLFINSNPIIYKTPLFNHLNLFLNEYGIKNNQDLPLNINSYLQAQNYIGEKFSYFVENQYLSKTKIKTLLKKNMIELGTHTKSHKYLNMNDNDILDNEIILCHQKLEKVIGEKIRYFSFPFGNLGDYNYRAELLAIKIANDYFSCNGGINKSNVPGAILRIGSHNENISELASLLKSQPVR
jgi:peptidoglycan/xylan/chitin deacetylase (PgdA/CDA1 family)/folate-dependent phosphoribosylglycinamide formyltransferase PurN